jgi:hypothetical protein
MLEQTLRSEMIREHVNDLLRARQADAIARRRHLRRPVVRTGSTER